MIGESMYRITQSRKQIKYEKVAETKSKAETKQQPMEVIAMGVTTLDSNPARLQLKTLD